MKVMQIVPSMNIGGVERGTLEIAKALKNADIGSYLLSSGGSLISSFTNSNTKFIKLPVNSKNPFTIFFNSRRIAKIVKENQINILHARSRAPAWSAYSAAKKTNSKFITTFHGVYSINSALKKKYNSIMTKGDKVIVVSNYVKNHVLENYEVDESKLVLIHRGIDLDFFDPEKVTKERFVNLTKSFEHVIDKFVIALPARLTRWKGHEFILDVLSDLKDEANFLCLFVGEGENESYRHELDKKIDRYNLKDHVVFTGKLSDMPALYKMVDLVLVPSLRPEAFGRVIGEAGAMGKIVIASNIGAAPEIIKHEETGYLLELDREQFKNKIINIFNTPKEERIKMGERAMEHIRANFSLKKMQDKTIEIYKELSNSN